MILLNERVVINGNDINIGNIKIPAGDHSGLVKTGNISSSLSEAPHSCLSVVAWPSLTSLSPLSQSLSLSEINHGSFIRERMKDRET